MDKCWLILFLFTSSAASGASFDCAKAETSQEKAICASPRLSQVDTQLAAAYGKLLASVPANARAVVRKDERDWPRSVDDRCPAKIGEKALEGCLAPAWDERVRFLESASSVGQRDGITFLWHSVHFTQADTGEVARDDAERGALRYSSLDAEWPQALSTDPDWRAWNRAIELMARNLASQGHAKPGDPWAKPDWMDGMDNNVSVTLETITPVFVGASFQNLWYGHGAAHPNFEKLQFNWLLQQRRELRPEDVFRPDSGWQKVLYERAMEWLKAPSGLGPKFPESWGAPGYWEDMVSKIVGNPQNWILDTNGLTLYFPPNSLTREEYKADLLPWKELTPMLQAGFRM